MQSNRIVGILLLIVSLFAVAYARPPYPSYCQFEYPFCEGGGPISYVNDGDVIDVLYLEAPVFQMKFGPLFGLFNLFHSAVGFQNRNTRRNYTVEYDAVFEVPNATFPFVLNSSSSDLGKELLWCNQGAVCTLNTIDYEYYKHAIYHMTTINGRQFNQLIDWLHVANETYLTYQLWNVYDHWRENQYVKALTCCEFAWKIFGKLQTLGADFSNAPKLKHDFINLYADITPVDDSDVAVQKRLIEFYNDFQWKGKTKPQILQLMLKFLVNEKFIYVDGKYFKLNMRYPYFGFHYAPDPIVPVD